MCDLISIVIPVFNAENYIQKCLQSIDLQTYVAYEVLIINDGSTDGSEQICLAFIKDKPQFSLYTKVNEGVSVARNYGIARALGTYLTFIDADDSVASTYLEKLYAPFENDSELGLSCGGYIELSKYHENGIALHDFNAIVSSTSTIDQHDFFNHLFIGVTGVLWGKMFVSSIIKTHSITLDPNIRLSEDLVFVFEYVSYVKKIALVKDHLYFYNRLNENGLSGALHRSNLNDVVLSNHTLADLNKKVGLPNFDFILNKRYVDGVFKITKDIALSTNSITDKIKDLELVRVKAEGALATNISFLKKEQKVHFTLFRKNYLVLLIIYCKSLNVLRKFKNRL